MYQARKRLRTHTVASGRALKWGQKRYRHLLGLLAEKGANICLVTYPVSPAYASARDDASWRGASADHDRAITFFQTEAQRINARYWDARGHTADLSLLRDIDHLNATGAKLFSKDLIKACFG